MILTENVLVFKSKGQTYPYIRQINLCGMHLDDVSIMKNLHELEVVVLSANDVFTLVDFENIFRLRELHLRKNAIADLAEIKYLKNIINLQVLSLVDNPCVEKAGPDYRLQVIHTLPQLKVLDNIEISDFERAQAQNKKYEILAPVKPMPRPNKPSTSENTKNFREAILERPARSPRKNDYDERPCKPVTKKIYENEDNLNDVEDADEEDDINETDTKTRSRPLPLKKTTESPRRCNRSRYSDSYDDNYDSAEDVATPNRRYHRESNYDSDSVNRRSNSSLEFSLFNPETGRNVKQLMLNNEKSCLLAATFCLVQKLTKTELVQLHNYLNCKIQEDAFNSLNP